MKPMRSTLPMLLLSLLVLLVLLAANRTGVTAQDQAPEAPGAAQMMATMFVGERAAPKTGKKRHLDTDQPIAFVAVDLLRVDESDLLDLPLMERKRLLDGALRQDERIRITPFVRPPIESFGSTWRGMGFEEIVYKGENSRYYPGRRNDEWTIAPIPKR